VTGTAAAQAPQPRPAQHPEFDLEQRHLDGTVAAQLRQVDQWEDRDRNVGADLETSLTLADTAEELAAMLSVHLHEPVFGNIKLRIGGKDQIVYVGKHGFRDLHGPYTVVSWESDVGALFYQETTEWRSKRGLPGTIHRRRQLDVKSKRLLKVTDLYDDQSGGDTGGREEVLIERLSELSTTGMTQVLRTLQPEQSAVMRATAGQHMILQGTAGSGKTTVAFHRLVWLIHPERGPEQARREACLVLMPNAVLAHYTSRVLPELGLEGVVVTTPEQWALQFLMIDKMTTIDRTLNLVLQDRDAGRRRHAWMRAKAVSAAVMLDVIRAHLNSRILSNLGTHHLDLKVQTRRGPEQVKLSAEALRALFVQVAARDPNEGLRPAFREALTLALLDTLPTDEEQQLRRQLAPDVTRTVQKLFTGLLPVSEARRLLSSREQLAAAGAGLISDQMIALLLSDPLAAVGKPKGNSVDATELPLMLTVAGLLDGLGRREGHVLTPYDHLMMDEGQDLAPLMYRLLARAVRPGHITVMGDVLQSIQGFRGIGRWKEVQDVLPGAQMLTLSRTYRSTRQITDLARRVAASYNQEVTATGVDRSGPEVARYVGGDVAALTAQAIKVMQAQGYRNIGVIIRRMSDATGLVDRLAEHDVAAEALLNDLARYRGGVVVIPTVLAKGLEMDGCVVVGADAQTYDPGTEYESRCLFVGVTRALHALALVAETELHPLLREDAPVGA